MSRIAVVYHSGHGHTELFARNVAQGAGEAPDSQVSLLKAEHLASAPEKLVAFDGLIWGSPTYLGGVSGPFKSFMDSTGTLWRNQALRGKLACTPSKATRNAIIRRPTRIPHNKPRPASRSDEMSFGLSG
jgi:multimeric flavodoxin WrbA